MANQLTEREINKSRNLFFAARKQKIKNLPKLRKMSISIENPPWEEESDDEEDDEWFYNSIRR